MDFLKSVFREKDVVRSVAIACVVSFVVALVLFRMYKSYSSSSAMVPRPQLLKEKLIGIHGELSSTNSALSDLRFLGDPCSYTMIAVWASSEELPLTNVCYELHHSLAYASRTRLITSHTVLRKFGLKEFERYDKAKFSKWLNKVKDRYERILFKCDDTWTSWTKECIERADCILIMALSSADTNVSKTEEQLCTLTPETVKKLVLLHHDNGQPPTTTAKWIEKRDWCHSHYHIRCPSRVFEQDKTYEEYENLLPREPECMTDFARLSRFLTGSSIGVVLSGGGAKGSAHVGFLQALYEAKIPVDMIGGTSIGSFMGALWSEETIIPPVIQRAKNWCMEMRGYWRQIFDITYPYVSIFSGRWFNQRIKNTFNDRQIEDLWIPYFCITTDLTSSSMRVHTRGCLWKYVRASMSPAFYLPPLCDPVDGHMLLDGGYLNNLPADVMHWMGAKTILAIDIGSPVDNDLLSNFGEYLSGWQVLWSYWWPWAETLEVLTAADIQIQLTYASSVHRLEVIKRSRKVQYAQLPTSQYHSLQFSAFEELNDLGYDHGKLLIQEWNSKNIFTSTDKKLQTDEGDVQESLRQENKRLEDQVTFLKSENESLLKQLKAMKETRNN